MTSFKDMKISIEGDPAMEARLRESMPKTMEKEYTLTFNKTESIYEQEQKLEAGPRGDSHFSFGEGRQYINLKDKTSITESDFVGKEFIVTDSLRHRKWILGTETKKIGNYTCFKATDTIKIEAPTAEAQEKAKERGIDLLSMIKPKTIIVTAWYTPEIPVAHGPGDYGGLPGLVLEVNNDRTVLLCTKVTINPKEKVEIAPPTKGKKVTQEEYMEIMRKKSEEMMEMHRPAPGAKKSAMSVTFGD
jgi:GLPGLI family protein